jgi:hypothetical protein
LTGLAGPHDDLQIVAHAAETVTPAIWGERAHDLLGGHLAVLPDGGHASLTWGDTASAAVAYLRDGTPIP